MKDQNYIRYIFQIYSTNNLDNTCTLNEDSESFFERLNFASLFLSKNSFYQGIILELSSDRPLEPSCQSIFCILVFSSFFGFEVN